MAVQAESLIGKLPLVDENILAEAAKQPILFIEAARYRVTAMRVRAKAVAELEARKSTLALRIRAKKTSARSITENAIKETVESQKSVIALRDRVEKAYALEEFSKLILEAYRQRRDAIRIIGETQIAEGIRGSHEVDRLEQSRKLRNRARDLEERRRRVPDGEDE